MSVCGIDLGSFKTTSYVAWLEDRQFSFDVYIPSKDKPLPTVPFNLSTSTHFAIDGPQSLPAIESKRRECDRLANTPTRVLPKNRQELQNWKMYKELIHCGVEVFWSSYKNGFANLGGLNKEVNDIPIILETYPRYVIKRIWPSFMIPSKRKTPVEYVNKLIPLIKMMDYEFDESKILSPDYIDAILCAIAAENYLITTGNCLGRVGVDPIVDEENQILREGYIYSI
jgi:predicted nuclease with RNAse H fold